MARIGQLVRIVGTLNRWPTPETSTVLGVGVPKATPVEIIDKLNREINAALADPKIKARFADLEAHRLSARPPTLESSSPTKPKSGARW
jgi:Tripartite tricarboxylate transporter family receptor